VTRDQLPALEYVMQRRMGRTDVGVMMSGCGAGRGGDVFAEAARFVKARERRWAPSWSIARVACKELRCMMRCGRRNLPHTALSTSSHVGW